VSAFSACDDDALCWLLLLERQWYKSPELMFAIKEIRYTLQCFAEKLLPVPRQEGERLTDDFYVF